MFNLERRPTIEKRKYYGSITIQELTAADLSHIIDFSIEVTEDNFGDTKIYYDIYPIIKNINYAPFRGKEKILIRERVLEEIKKQKIRL